MKIEICRDMIPFLTNFKSLDRAMAEADMLSRKYPMEFSVFVDDELKHTFINSEKQIDYELGKNNGGKTDYYQLASSPFPINDADDFAEWRKMNFFQGNILKVVWTFNTGRHSGTDEIRDLNKIIHYANREKERIERESNL